MGRWIAHSGCGRWFAPLLLCGALVSCASASKPGKPATGEPPIRIGDNFSADALEERFEAVVRRVSPAVVAVSATDADISAESRLRGADLNPDKLAGMLESVDRTVGTGFVIDSDGFVVTNDHVVSGARQLWVTTDSRRVLPAIRVASDPRTDIAVLKIPARGLPAVQISLQPARRGQWTIAVGNPYGLAGAGEMSASVGILSATRRSLPRLSGSEDRLYIDLLQTTAQINPGNSGGPLFDLNGKVIGINTAVILPQKRTNGIGFAIPMSDSILRIIDDLKQGRPIVHGYLGVSVVSATDSDRRDAGFAGGGGAKIESVDPDSPAAAADLHAGDVIADFDGRPVLDSDDFIHTIGLCAATRPIEARVYHHGPRTVRVLLRPRPNTTEARNDGRLRWHGMLLGPIPACWDFGTARPPARGVMVIAVEAGCPFLADGVRSGSVITSIAGRPVGDVADLRSVLLTADSRRGGANSRRCPIQLFQPADSFVSAE